MKKKLLQENEIKDNYALFNIEDDIAVVMKTLNSDCNRRSFGSS